MVNISTCSKTIGKITAREEVIEIPFFLKPFKTLFHIVFSKAYLTALLAKLSRLRQSRRACRYNIKSLLKTIFIQCPLYAKHYSRSLASSMKQATMPLPSWSFIPVRKTENDQYKKSLQSGESARKK